MAAAQTGSNTISAHRTARNEIPTPISIIIFDVGLGGRHMFFRYNATSGCAGDNVDKPGDIENMGIAVRILLLRALELEI